MDPHGMDVAEGVRWWGERQCRRADEALGAWLAGDAEGLHDFRVALRRLLSVVETFEPLLRLKGAPRRRLKRLIRRTNEARDLEVAAAEVAGWAERLSEPAATVAREWAEALAQERDRAHVELRAVLPRLWRRTGRRLAKALKILEARRPLSWAQATAEGVRERADALRLALARVSGPRDGAGLHRARLACKRLRYLLEPFRDYDDDARLAVLHLKELQGLLGELHDLEGLRRRAGARMAQGCESQMQALAEAVFYSGEEPAWCPPPLLGLVRALGERHREGYAALEAFRSDSARWHGLALSAAAVLTEPLPPAGGEEK